MNETYVECLVKSQTGVLLKFLKYLLYVLTALIGLFSLLASFLLGFIVAIGVGVAAYFVNLYTDIEYEYLYVDKEISIDRIMAKSKRKKVATFDVEKMEIMAPINSYHLDDYKNRQIKADDYSSKVISQPDKRYVFFYEGQKKVIIEPSNEFVKAVYNVAPRKVFTD